MKFAFRYTTALSSGLLKSRALLLAEELRARPDWETIRHDPKAIEAALPEDLRGRFSPLRHKPIVWFSLQQFFEGQARFWNETKPPAGDAGRKQLFGVGELQLDIGEMYLKGEGLVRLGMPRYLLHSWRSLMIAADFGLLLRKALELGDRYFDDDYNARFVMGFVGAALPLRMIERVEKVENGGWTPMDLK
jgi:hypothetical protein